MYDHLRWAGIVPCTPTHARYYAKETFPVLLLVKFLHTDREILAAFTPTGNFSKANAHCTKCLVPQLGAVCAGIYNMSKGVDFDTSAAEGKGTTLINEQRVGGYVKAFFWSCKGGEGYAQSTLHPVNTRRSCTHAWRYADFQFLALARMVHALHASYSFRSDRLYKRRMSQDCLPLFLPSFLQHENTEKFHNNCYTTKDDLDHVSNFLIETAANIPTSCYLASSNHLWQRKAPNLRTWPHVLKASSSQVT